MRAAEQAVKKQREVVSEEDVQRFSAELERRRLVQIIGLAVVVVVAALAVLARLTGSDLLGLPVAVWIYLAAGLLLAKIVLLLARWRCPSCGALLGSSYSPRFCSGCGLEFRGSGKS